MCRHGHSNTQQTQHFPHWRIYHRIQIWWNCQNICYFHTCQQQQQQLRRLYIAHRCMDFCRAGTPKTDWSSGLDWEELFLEHISVRGGNCLLLSFLSPREGFQWNKKRKKKRWEGADVLLYGAGTPSQRSTDVRNLAENTDALVGEQVMQGRRDEDTFNLPLIRVSVKVSISPQSVPKYKWFTHLCMCVCVCVCACFCLSDRLSSLQSFPRRGKVDPPAVAQVTATMKAAVFISGRMTDCSPSVMKLMDTGARFGLNARIHF